MKDIAIYGAGGFGREVACLLRRINEQAPQWNLRGFFDDGKESTEKEKPFSVNLVNGIWVIEGHIPNGNDSALTFCGQSYVEIRKSNGEIIELLHTK